MANDIQNEIEATKAKLAELESLQKIQGKLATLHSEYGFSDLNSFIKALKRAAGSSVKRGRPAKAAVAAPSAAAPGAAAPSVAAAPKAVKAKKGKRARITPEVKEQVKTLISAGKTGAEIAKTLGISLPSVQNIKKEFGLVKKRG
jgi:DNA-binding NarL/FixJ family response regulator